MLTLYTRAEAVRFSGICRTSIERLLDNGSLQAIIIKQVLYIQKEELERESRRMKQRKLRAAQAVPIHAKVYAKPHIVLDQETA